MFVIFHREYEYDINDQRSIAQIFLCTRIFLCIRLLFRLSLSFNFSAFDFSFLGILGFVTHLLQLFSLFFCFLSFFLVFQILLFFFPWPVDDIDIFVHHLCQRRIRFIQVNIIGMQCLDSGVFEPNSNRSFDDADRSFQRILARHDYLSFSCSFPDFQIFQIEQFPIFVSAYKDKRFSFMQKHICHHISFFQVDGFDSSSSLTHRSEIAALEKQHPSLFGDDADIIRLIHGLYTDNSFLVGKLHDDSREFFERENELFLDLLNAVLIGQEDQMLIVKMQRFGEDDLSFESEMLIEIQCILLHDKAS